jgi:hypothetical protein
MHFAVKKAAGINSHPELMRSRECRWWRRLTAQSMPFAPKNGAVKEREVSRYDLRQSDKVQSERIYFFF